MCLCLNDGKMAGCMRKLQIVLSCTLPHPPHLCLQVLPLYSVYCRACQRLQQPQVDVSSVALRDCAVCPFPPHMTCPFAVIRRAWRRR